MDKKIYSQFYAENFCLSKPVITVSLPLIHQSPPRLFFYLIYTGFYRNSNQTPAFQTFYEQYEYIVTNKNDLLYFPCEF